MTFEEKEFILTFHKMVSDLYDNLLDILTSSNNYLQSAMKNMEYVEELNPVNRFYFSSLIECISIFRFMGVFNNELFAVKEIDPLEKFDVVMEFFPVIMTNVQNFSHMINRFIKPDYRNEIVNNKEWIKIDTKFAKITKEIFSLNDDFIEIMIEFIDDFNNFCERNGQAPFFK